MTITVQTSEIDQAAAASLTEAEKYRAYQDRLDGSWGVDTEWQRSFEGETLTQDLLHEEAARV